MKNLQQALKKPTFYWRPVHLQHITENIAIKKRNISFLAINALFRQKNSYNILPSEMGNDHFIIEDFVDLQPNDRTRIYAERLRAIFFIDDKNNIVVKTAYSQNDSNYQ